MGRVFLNKKFSDYLGENRALLDIIVRFVPDPSSTPLPPTPTPTPTPSITPTITGTPAITPSITPSISPTLTPTNTPSITPSITPSVSVSLTPTLTPSITPSITPTISLTPSPQYLCNSFVNPPDTINGITITQSFSGAATPYIFSPQLCCGGAIFPPAGGIYVGFGGAISCPPPIYPFSYTLNFTSGVNDIDIVIYGGGCAGGLNEELFNITTSEGNPTLSFVGSNCFTTFTGNTVAQGLGCCAGISDTPFAKFNINAPSNFTSLTITGNGGYLGAVIGLCSDSIPFPTTPTNTPTTTPTITPSVSVSLTPTNTPTNTPSISPTNTPSITPTNTPSITPSPTPTPNPACDITYTVLPSPTPSITPTNTPSISPTNTPSITPTNTPSITPSITPTNTATPTPTVTPSASPSPAFDPDAAAYLSAVVSAGGSLNATISGATDTLFTSLKSASLYSKLSYMYPLIGSTPNSMKIEAKSLSATYDIFFVSNGGNFTTNGYNPNLGVSYYYAQFTNVFGNSISPSGDIHMGLYITLAATGNNSGYGLCASDGNNSNQNYIFTKFNNGNTLFYSWIGAYGTTLSDPSGLGHYILTRNISNTNTQLYKNGSVIADVSQGYYACTTSYFLGAEIANGAAVGGRNSQTYSFVHFGNKLDASEQSTLSTIINTFQTTLGRNTY